MLQKILNETTISNQTHIKLAKLRSTQNLMHNAKECHTSNYMVF